MLSLRGKLLKRIKSFQIDMNFFRWISSLKNWLFPREREKWNLFLLQHNIALILPPKLIWKHYFANLNQTSKARSSKEIELLSFVFLVLIGPLFSQFTEGYLTHWYLSSIHKMAFGFYSLLEACLLVVNAMAVLNEERFLSKSRYQNYSAFIFIKSFFPSIFYSNHKGSLMANGNI